MIAPARFTAPAAIAAPNTLLGQATLYLGGNAPRNYIDFTSNRALISGVDVGTVSQIPSISGTLNLSSSGQLISTAANGLIIPLSGLTYPLSLFVEFVRLTDTGANEAVAVLDSGTAANLTMYRVDTGDQLRFRIDATPPGSNQCNVGGGTPMTSVPTAVQRAAGRANTNSAQNCRNGTLGTEDTSVTLPVSPTRLIVGVDSSGAIPFPGYIRRVATFNSALSDAQLQAATTT